MPDARRWSLDTGYIKQVTRDKILAVSSSRGAKRRGDLIGYNLLNEIAALRSQ